MKRLLIALLFMGIVMAFSVSAFALNADFQGKLYVRGWYIDNPTMQDKTTGKDATSTALVDQRLRLFTNFKVMDGVSIIMRMDILEDKWGGQPSSDFTDMGSSGDVMGETLQIDRAYMDFDTALGNFKVGFQRSPITFGTEFLDSSNNGPALKYTKKLGALTLSAGWKKNDENGAIKQAWVDPQSDKDSDSYNLQAVYKGKALDAGAQWVYLRDATNRAASGGGVTAIHAIDPYVKAKVGKLNFESEIFYVVSGDYKADAGGGKDQKIKAKGGYLEAKYNVGPAYLGVGAVYMSGDDPTTGDIEGGMIKIKSTGSGMKKASQISVVKQMTGATSLNPAEILFSESSGYVKQTGKRYTVPSTGDAFDNTMDNVRLLYVTGGYSVTPKLAFDVSFIGMKIDKAPLGYVSDALGRELDFHVNYKIYDPLVFEFAGAYLWTGDFFKGRDSNNKIDDNYFLRSALELSF